MTKDDFMETVKKFKAKISSSIFPELMKEFQISKTTIDVKAMREKYLSLYPECQPASPKRKIEDQTEGGEGEAGVGDTENKSVAVDEISNKEMIFLESEDNETDFDPFEEEEESTIFEKFFVLEEAEEKIL